MNRSRITSAALKVLVEELPDRYTTPLPHLARVRVLTGAQLDRLLAEPDTAPETTARVRRRIMARLSESGLVTMLARRVGGHRAGSAGHVYTLTSAGYVFLALLNGDPAPPRIRHTPRPGDLFLTHALTISNIYADLAEKSRDGGFSVHTFSTEPACWHPTGSGVFLRPDAYTVLHTGTHADYWWLETDTGTESLPRLRGKIRTYHDFFITSGTGPDGVPPRLLFTTADPARAETITHLASMAMDGGLITATTHGQAAAFMITELHNPD